VSPATVSRVLNQPDLVKPATRDAVYSAMERHRYVPPATSSMPQEQLGVIGLAVHDVHLAVTREIIRDLSDHVTQAGFNLLVINTAGERDLERFFRDHTHYRRQLDALIAFSMDLEESGAELFRDLDLPLVVMQARSPATKSISTNNYLGGHDATEYLLSRGYQRIAFVGWEKEDPRLRGRLAGYRSVVVQEGLTAFRPLSEEGGYEATAELFAPDRRAEQCPDAIFFACDAMALGGLRFLRDHNIAVPEEVGVVGFDDIEAAKLVGLTTMEQFIAKKAEIAITYLKGRLSGELTQPQNDELSITPRIVVRGTTK
jgi:DNA-binding LacI/PurR family transcriptional regulator